MSLRSSSDPVVNNVKEPLGAYCKGKPLLILSPGLINFFRAIRRAYKGWQTEKAFQNKLYSSADQNTF